MVEIVAKREISLVKLLAENGVPYSEIRRALPLSSRQRPLWDVEALRRTGFARACCDKELSGRIYPHDDTAAYNPVPMFALRAVR